MRPTVRSAASLLLATSVAAGTLVASPAAAGIDDLAPTPPTPSTPLTFSIHDAEVVEGDPGDGHVLAFEIVANHAWAADVTFRADTGHIGFEATPDVDFTPVDEIVTLPAGSTSTTVEVPVIGDEEIETDAEGPHELVVVWLGDESAGTVVDDTALGTIHDDDLPEINIDDLTMEEGTGGPTGFHFTVSLDHPSDEVVTVDVSVAPGSAQTPSDYQAVPAVLQFAPGETELDYVVSVVGDSIDEPNEGFAVELSNAQGGTIIGGGGLGTIVDDDLADGPGSFTIERLTRLLAKLAVLAGSR